jgi:hypothetical protein
MSKGLHMNLASHVEDFRASLSRAWPPTFDRLASDTHRSLEQGMALIHKASVIPSSVTSDKEVCDGWNSATLSGAELEKLLHGSDWQWSYYVPSLTGSAWGLTTEQAVRRSVSRLLNEVEMKGLNSAEIASIRVRRFFGLILATVRLEQRNLQLGPFLKPLDPRYRFRRPLHHRDLINVANRKGLHMKAM